MLVCVGTRLVNCATMVATAADPWTVSKNVSTVLNVASVHSVNTIEHEEFRSRASSIRTSTLFRLLSFFRNAVQAVSQVRDLRRRFIANRAVDRSSRLHHLLTPLWMSFLKTSILDVSRFRHFLQPNTPTAICAARRVQMQRA
jgi:hypothetical protein